MACTFTKILNQVFKEEDFLRIYFVFKMYGTSDYRLWIITYKMGGRQMYRKFGSVVSWQKNIASLWAIVSSTVTMYSKVSCWYKKL